MKIMACKQSFRNTLVSSLIAAGLIELPLVAPVYAQGVLEEVIVVARKREESLQETPIAVTALNTEALREAQVNNVGDLTREAPGLTRREGRKFADLAIRGVGALSLVPGQQRTYGVELYYSW